MQRATRKKTATTSNTTTAAATTTVAATVVTESAAAPIPEKEKTAKVVVRHTVQEQAAQLALRAKNGYQCNLKNEHARQQVTSLFDLCSEVLVGHSNDSNIYQEQHSAPKVKKGKKAPQSQLDQSVAKLMKALFKTYKKEKPVKKAAAEKKKKKAAPKQKKQKESKEQ